MARVGATLQATLEGQAGTVVRLCGPLVLEIRGRRVEAALPSRQGRLVFAYLVLHRARAVSRDELIEALWPGRAPASPGTLLTGLLSRLRRALPAGVLEGRSQLALRLGPDTWIDVEVAAAAVGRAQQALQGGCAGEATAIARAGLEILERPLLPELDRPWVDERRRELNDLVPVGLEVMARSALAAGGVRLAEGETAARRLIERAPFRESAHALLMEVLAARGDVAQALQVYEALRTLLRDELGTVPGAAVRALSKRLLAEGTLDGAPQPTAPILTTLGGGVSSPVTAPLRSPVSPRMDDGQNLEAVDERFVGRRRELAALDGALDALRAPRPRWLVVSGEPGIGKTRLLPNSPNAPLHAAIPSFVGRGAELESELPFAMWVDALDDHVGALGDAGFGLDRRSRRRARPRAAVGRTGRRRRPAGRALPRLSCGARAAAAAGECGARVVLILDDVHWADDASLELIAHLLRRPAARARC